MGFWEHWEGQILINLCGKKNVRNFDVLQSDFIARCFTVRSVNAFLAAALTRVMRATVPIPALASASVLHSAAVGGSVVGVVGPL